MDDDVPDDWMNQTRACVITSSRKNFLFLTNVMMMTATTTTEREDLHRRKQRIWNFHPSKSNNAKTISYSSLPESIGTLPHRVRDKPEEELENAKKKTERKRTRTRTFLGWNLEEEGERTTNQSSS